MTQSTLNKVRGYYEGAIKSSAYQKWRAEAQQAWNFYDGNQWSQEELDKLAENSQPAIVINKISAKIDNIAGTEIAGRTRILYRSRSGEETEEKMAKVLSDLALYVAERNDQASEVSNMFKEGLISGIAWLDVGVEKSAEGYTIFNRCENSNQVVWDTTSSRLDYSDARFVARERWLDLDQLKMMFPENYESLASKIHQAQRNSVAGVSRASSYNPLINRTYSEEVSYFNDGEEKLRVVEVQYKKTEKQYVVKTPLGKEFVTFEKSDAYADKENTVSSHFASRVYIAYFSEDILLSDNPLGYHFNNFTLTPYIFKKNKSDGRPYGLLRNAIDPQRELNKRRSKAMHLLNTAQVIADIDAVEDPSILAKEAARPDGIILKRPGKELRIIRNSDLAASQVAVMEQSSKDIQEVMGVFDETIGKTSNATSGVAIQNRQQASNLNQMFAFDALRRTKKQLGMQVLSMIRQFFTTEMVISISDSLSASRVVHLNNFMLDENGEKRLDSDGNPLKENDVRTGIFDVHVEEVRDVLSSRELEVNQLNMLMQSGVPIPPKVLVEATSLRQKDEIIQALESQANNEEV